MSAQDKEAHPNRELVRARLDQYVAMVQYKIEQHWEDRGYTWKPDQLWIQMGRKYARIVAQASNVHRESVHTFVNMENGDILKAGSWKAPASRGVRGNIFADDRGASVVDHHGANYLNGSVRDWRRWESC